jgi:hypothetical protein
MLATPALTGNNADRIGSSCRVDVRASLLSSIPQGGPDLFWQAIPAWHLFIVCRDDMGKTMMYEGDKGGAGVDGTFGALIGSEPKELSSLPPRSNEAITPYSATVMSGPEACGMSACVGRALRSFNQQKPAVAYNPFGPNSNTLAKTLLTSCNIPIDKPPVFTLGWDSDPLR